MQNYQHNWNKLCKIINTIEINYGGRGGNNVDENVDDNDDDDG